MSFQFRKALGLASVGYLFAAISTASSEQADDPFKWTCGTPDFVNDYTLDRSGIRYNNFILQESDSETIKGLRAINFSYTVLNRSDKPYRFSMQVVGFDKAGMPTFVVSNSSSYAAVEPKSTNQAGGGVHVLQGDLGRTSKICLRTIGSNLAP
jgi:hypothetical protein